MENLYVYVRFAEKEPLFISLITGNSRNLTDVCFFGLGALENVSNQGVNKLLRRVNTRGLSRKRKQEDDFHQCDSIDMVGPLSTYLFCL